MRMPKPYMDQLEIRLLGSLQMRRAGRILGVLPPQRTALLCYLLLGGDRPQPRSQVAGLFWPDYPEERARRNLNDTLYHVNRHLAAAAPAGEPLLFRGDAGYIVRTPAVPLWLDVEEFVRLVRTASPDALQTAVDLYTGDLLPEIFGDWAGLQRERLAGLYRGALARLATHYEQLDALEQAVATARRLVGADPLNEEAVRLAMRLLHRTGRRDLAVQTYHTLCRQLIDELDDPGAQPEPATVELFELIQARVAPAPPAPPGASVAAAASSSEPAAVLDVRRRLQDLPLLGRDEERGRLMAWLEGPRETVRPLMLLVGEAGIGKSRLATEVADAAYRSGTVVLRGHYHELSAPLPYGGLVEALRSGLTLAPPPAAAPVWLAEVSRVLPELTLLTPGLPVPPTLPAGDDRLRLWEGLVQYLLALVARGPHLVIIEDIQWIDPATLDWLQYLLPRLPSSGFRVLATARAEDLADRPELVSTIEMLESSAMLERMEVHQLSAEAIALIVRHGLELQNVPRDFGGRLWAATEGNPYFALETLQLWIERGILQRRPDGEWDTPGISGAANYAGLPTPANVKRVLGQRLQRVSRAGRLMIEVGAVLGDSFAEALLAPTSGSTEEAIGAPVEELLQRRLWVTQPGGPTATRHCTQAGTM